MRQLKILGSEKNGLKLTQTEDVELFKALSLWEKRLPP